jgi:hypothetical protein
MPDELADSSPSLQDEEEDAQRLCFGAGVFLA